MEWPLFEGPLLCRPVLFEHDLVGKPQRTFPDHALAFVAVILDDHRSIVMAPTMVAPAMVAMPGMMPIAVHVIAVLDNDRFSACD
jgi:hypothetical protein